MTVNSIYPTGYVDVRCFRRIDNEFFIYHSPIRHREYELHLIDGCWTCNCPDKRHNEAKCCKHEQALARLWKQHQARKSLSMSKAEMQEQIAQTAAALSTFARATNERIAALRAEVTSLRAELAEVRAAQIAPDLGQIMQEIAALKQENAEIKRVLATKATARRKHMRETEAAEIKRGMNMLAEDVVSAAQNAIKTVGMLKDRLADLEAIPHELKAELDSWTEAGKEKLQPDYRAPEPAPEIKKAIRDVQEAERERRRRQNAPLNGNNGFQLMR